MKIVCLGPPGTNFSELAYMKMAGLFSAPHLGSEEDSLAQRNEDILPLIIGHNGFGAIAMETEAEGRVEGPVNSFIQLLDRFSVTGDCPTTVIGALRMSLNFVLMARRGVALKDVKTVIAHPKSFGACKHTIRALHVQIVESNSNGQAAEDVKNKPEFAKAAALGPRIAAEKYKLPILREFCEDRPRAVTTFFLLGPKTHRHSASLREVNRSLLVLRIKNEPGRLTDVLTPFKKAGINVRHIGDYYTGSGHYDFAVQFDCRRNQIKGHSEAMHNAIRHMQRYILFGPFPVITTRSA